ncbi:hypothetical protein FH972_024007 [Carpinus fangiana]|uniref:BZIP domain-containing protein n=1 Tax=Carpinus fangiana TaxID=176857 RepID=A0A5N6KWS5_9ROSI|nr:hypothetical protein FH972_024007 [Carpinus fangiana]
MAATLQEINAMYGAGSADPQAPGYAPSSSETQGGLDLLKNLGSDKKLKADGQPPKRRGPKPDSKPALTRRQELNRQAQRTHRERKEKYIQALEQEVLRLKEQYLQCSRERDNFAEENRRLKTLLAKHGINIPGDLFDPISSSGSFSGSYHGPSTSTSLSPPPNSGSTNTASPAPPQLDYDQTGIDFVLSLERPCMEHMQMLCVNAQESEGEISGHALMATCPPQSHLIERPDVAYQQKLESSDLLRLLDLSNRLPLDGEITPVMAWSKLFQHEDFHYLNAQDIEAWLMILYSFGAVLEEFELKDTIASVLAQKNEQFTTCLAIRPLTSTQLTSPQLISAEATKSDCENRLFRKLGKTSTTNRIHYSTNAAAPATAPTAPTKPVGMALQAPPVLPFAMVLWADADEAVEEREPVEDAPVVVGAGVELAPVEVAAVDEASDEAADEAPVKRGREVVDVGVGVIDDLDGVGIAFGEVGGDVPGVVARVGHVGLDDGAGAQVLRGAAAQDEGDGAAGGGAPLEVDGVAGVDGAVAAVGDAEGVLRGREDGEEDAGEGDAHGCRFGVVCIRVVLWGVARTRERLEQWECGQSERLGRDDNGGGRIFSDHYRVAGVLTGEGCQGMAEPAQIQPSLAPDRLEGGDGTNRRARDHAPLPPARKIRHWRLRDITWWCAHGIVGARCPADLVKAVRWKPHACQICENGGASRWQGGAQEEGSTGGRRARREIQDNFKEKEQRQIGGARLHRLCLPPLPRLILAAGFHRLRPGFALLQRYYFIHSESG